MLELFGIAKNLSLKSLSQSSAQRSPTTYRRAPARSSRRAGPCEVAVTWPSSRLDRLRPPPASFLFVRPVPRKRRSLPCRYLVDGRAAGAGPARRAGSCMTTAPLGRVHRRLSLRRSRRQARRDVQRTEQLARRCLKVVSSVSNVSQSQFLPLRLALVGPISRPKYLTPEIEAMIKLESSIESKSCTALLLRRKYLLWRCAITLPTQHLEHLECSR